MERYQYIKRVFSLLLCTHEFSLEKERNLPNGGKETHYRSNNTSLILGYSQQESTFYTKIWLCSQWITLHTEDCDSQITSFAKRVQKMEQEAEQYLLDSYLE